MVVASLANETEGAFALPSGNNSADIATVPSRGKLLQHNFNASESVVFAHVEITVPLTTGFPAVTSNYLICLFGMKLIYFVIYCRRLRKGFAQVLVLYKFAAAPVP